ncbi:MAG: glycosyltransferase family 2 protein [Phycisphaerae bacterium]|nr:glycosyltransferase family 2 protein [Phycisphaerae bacterium]
MPDPAPPSVSVAICTRDRPASLRRCVRAVIAQSTFPKELIVVDDGPLSSEVRQELASSVENAGLHWRYFTKPQSGLTRSRNLALAHASGEIVQFFDDDAEPAYHYLSEILAIFAADPDLRVAVLGGTVTEPALSGRGGRAWSTAAMIAGWWALGKRGMRRRGWPEDMDLTGRIVPTPNVIGAALAVRKSLVFPPGFDESLTGYALGEDRELAYRLARTHLVGLATRAHATHHHDPAGRIDPFRLGQATISNYCHILSKNTPMGFGEWLLIGWSMIVLSGLRLGFALFGDRRRHLAELGGMIQGGASWFWHHIRRTGCCW